jgi:Zn-dependent protease
MSLILWILTFIVAITVSITVHEAAHAWTADRLGDPTARLMGRLSLNPLVHYDNVGTTILLFTAILTILGRFPFPFGWAKPVVFDPYNLKNPRKDSALISIAGPAANLILAFFLSLILRIPGGPFSPLAYAQNVISFVILLNVALAVFNLIPIHPLDGGKVLVGLLPTKEAREVDLFLRRYGLLLLFLIIFPLFGGSSIFSIVVSPVFSFFLRLLIPGNPIV